MDEQKVRKELKSSLSTIKQHWQDKELHVEEMPRIEKVVDKFLLFSKQCSPSECKSIIHDLRSIIDSLSAEVRVEKYELEKETHGGREYLANEGDLMNDLGYRTEMRKWFEDALQFVYAERPEFKP